MTAAPALTQPLTALPALVHRGWDTTTDQEVGPRTRNRTTKRELKATHVPAGTAGEFSSPGSTFCADSYFGIRSTPVLPQ